jgi:hypothetical protein
MKVCVPLLNKHVKVWWKYNYNWIFFYFEMDETLICTNVFLVFSYYNHNLLKFSYKIMFENLKT